MIVGRRMAALSAAAAVAVGLVGPTTSSLAILADAATATGSATTQTLDPPTGLAASASGLAVALNWTASPDAAVAAGYQVLRATASGGPFSQVGTVTPATATSTTDTVPSSGTWYYTLRTYAGGAPWTSVATGAASAVVSVTTDTGWKACASQAAVTAGSGDNNGYQTAGAEACDDDSVFAVDPLSGTGTSTSCTATSKDRHTFFDFNLGVPITASAIAGIEVQGDWRVDANGTNRTVCARLSWNGGTSWTAYTALGVNLTTTETTYTIGSASSLWGRTWTASELSNTSFRVQIVDVANVTSRTFYLDGLKARVTYTP